MPPSTPLMRELVAIEERVPGARGAGLPVAPRGRNAGRGLRGRCARDPDAVARERVLLGGGGGLAGARPAPARVRAPGVSDGIEDRRPLDLAAVRRGPARARGDARRRRARRGRDGKRPDDPLDPARDLRDVRPRGPRRGLLYPTEGPFRRRQRGAKPKGASLREPAQRRGRDDEAPRFARDGPPRPGGLALRDRRRAGATSRRDARSLRGLGFRVNTHSRRCESFGEVKAFIEEWREKAPRARVRDGRRRDQGRRSRFAGAARIDGQVAALGARLQVSSRGENDGRRRHLRPGGADGRPDPGRASRPCSSPGRPSSGRRSTTTRTSPARTCGSATRSSSRRAATSSRRSSACS